MRITILLLVLGICSTFAQECGEEVFTHRYLQSNGFKVETELEDAAFIKSMTIEADEDDICEKKNENDTNVYYGRESTKPAYFVDHGCAGNFKIGFVRGVCEPITLSSHRPNITLENSCSIQSMACIRQHTNSSCTFDVSFTFYNNFAKVDSGCDCDFLICHAVKDIVPTQAATPTAAPANSNSNTNTNTTSMTNGVSDLGSYNQEQQLENSQSESASDAAEEADGHEHI